MYHFQPLGGGQNTLRWLILFCEEIILPTIKLDGTVAVAPGSEKRIRYRIA